MNKVIYLLLCIVFLIQGGTAQVITIKDRETNLPLESVILLSYSPRIYATTNAKGNVDISAFKECEKIEIHLIGYKTEIKSYKELEETGSVIYLKPVAVILDQVVVSALRHEESSKNIAYKIASITPHDISLHNPQTAADMLGLSGKVFIQKSQQAGGSPMIRGFATHRLLYAVDGVRMNTAIFRAGNIQNVISLDPFTMENTEVLFGPASLAYGSDAIGGVMSFQTLTPQFSTDSSVLVTGKALLRFSSANKEKTGHFDICIGRKKWAIISSISANDFDHLRMGSYGPATYLRPFYVMHIDSADVVVANPDPKVQIPSAYSQINMMQKVRYRPHHRWEFNYGFHYSETSDYSRYDRHLRLRNGLPRYGEWYYGPQKWMMNNISLNHYGNNALYNRMTVQVAWQYFEESRISRNFNKPTREIRTEMVDAYSINLDFIRTFREKVKLLYGAEVIWNEVTSKGLDENIFTSRKVPGPSRYPQSSWNSYAAYMTGQFNIKEKITLHAGTRYNYFGLDASFDTTFYHFPFTHARIAHDAITGNMGITIKPTEKLLLLLQGSTGFRSPNVDDMGKVFDSEPGSVTVPNPSLQAEYAYNAEASIVKQVGEWLKVDLTGYYTFLDKAMVRRDYTLNGQDSMMYDGVMSKIQAIQNAAFAYVYGIQAGLYIKMKNGLGFSSDITYQTGEEEMDDGTSSPLRHAVPWFGVTRIFYEKHHVTLQLYSMYQSEIPYTKLNQEEKAKTEIYAVDNNGNPYSPGWITLNFKMQYQLAEHLAISGGIENITDLRYRPYSSGIVAPGRNFILSLQYRF